MSCHGVTQHVNQHSSVVQDHAWFLVRSILIMELDSTSPNPEFQDLQRIEDLWFQDCGLVIQAERTLFRVSRDFLARQSPIFRDMLSLPTPEDAEKIDGCPLVRLPDTAEDVTCFLKALIYHVFCHLVPSADKLPILLSVLRMNHKYETNSLWKHALVLFSDAHPTSLRAWGDLNSAPHSFFRNCTESRLYHLVVSLAGQQSLEWVLPVAFYRMCRFTDPRVILESPLGIEDKCRVMSAWRRLDAQERNKMLKFLSLPWTLEGCASHARCGQARFDMREKIDQSFEAESANILGRLPLDLWAERFWKTLEPTSCSRCLAEMKTIFRLAMESFWESSRHVWAP